MKSRTFFTISMILITVLLASGCGGAKETGSPASTKSATSISTASPASPPVAGGKWRNIPLYPGAKETEKFSVTMPLQQEELKNIEYKFFETADKLEQVSFFFKAEMPKQGWEGAFMESSDFAVGSYTSQDENTLSAVILSVEKGKTKIILSVGTKK